MPRQLSDDPDKAGGALDVSRVTLSCKGCAGSIPELLHSPMFLHLAPHCQARGREWVGSSVLFPLLF